MAVRRTHTAATKVFVRSGPEAVVYDLSELDCVTITLPVASRWTSGPHWHESHTEYLQVLEGYAFVRLGLKAGVFGPDDGVIEVPKYTVHEWCRAREDGKQVRVREWTKPADGQKEIFFRSLNSFLTEAQPSAMYRLPAIVPRIIRNWLERWIIPLQLFCIFRACDNWPLFVGDDSGLVSWVFTHILLAAASAVGAILGLKGTYEEYVSVDLRRRAARIDENDTKKSR
jgi:hypothetical protein